jgi:conjugal transfer pilus assembly protein TraV
MLRPTFPLAALATLLALTGCSGMLSVGSESYSCPGIPNGVRCMSARAVLDATDYADSLETLTPRATPATPAQTKPPADSDWPQAPRAPQAAPVAAALVKPEPAAAIPTPQITPLRTPAKVLRKWVAQWEDDAGLLHGSEMMFAEVEGRKWQIGASALPGHPEFAAGDLAVLVAKCCYNHSAGGSLTARVYVHLVESGGSALEHYVNAEVVSSVNGGEIGRCPLPEHDCGPVAIRAAAVELPAVLYAGLQTRPGCTHGTLVEETRGLAETPQFRDDRPSPATHRVPAG